MKNIIQLVVIIIAVVALIIIIGFVIGTITHNMKIDKEQETTEQKTPISIIEEEISEPLLPEFEELFSLQIMASSNNKKIKLLQDKLKQENYETKISKLMRDGLIIYRLRLTGLYNEEDAIGLGEELKGKYASIEGYWLEEQETRTTSTSPKEEKMKPVEVSQKEQVKPEIEKEIKETKKKIDFGKECEVQLLASGDYARIEQIKTDLARKGYKTKILTHTEGQSIIYRLRLRGLYSEAEGNRLGNEVIKLSPNVSSFWLDEIKDGKSVGQLGTTKTVSTKAKVAQSSGDYEIQILANSKRSFVEERKRILDKAGYRAKIVSTTKNGKTYYRLRLADSYSRSKAKSVGDKLKKDVRFVSECWIVPKSGASTPAPKKATKKEKVEDRTLSEPTQSSLNPKYQPKYKKQQNTMTCVANDINIRIGPGTYYAVDPIGKLMKGVTVFVVDEKNDWIKFTITSDDDSWAGWVNKKYLK